MPAKNIKHSHGERCPCCGSDTAYTRGDVQRGTQLLARYLIKWTVGNPSHGMGWLISLPTEDGRRNVAVSLLYSFEHGSFMVQPFADGSWSEDDLAGVGELLDREGVIGTALSGRVFAIVDDIWLTDPYVQDFVASAKEE